MISISIIIYLIDYWYCFKCWTTNIKPGDVLLKEENNPWKNKEIIIVEVKKSKGKRWIMYKDEYDLCCREKLETLYKQGWRKL